jgi:hypothetical protein
MDVYDMLGVTPTSTIKEVRQSYKRLALICHPDKGGNPTDMRILKSSYDWICDQLSQVQIESEKGTYEERETAFHAFLKSQQDVPLPTIYEIAIDTLNIDPEILHNVSVAVQERFGMDNFLTNLVIRRALHEYDSVPGDRVHTIIDETLDIQKDGMIPASIEGGYGTILEESIVERLAKGQEDMPKPLQTAFGSMELIINPDVAPQPRSALISTLGTGSSVPLNIPVPKKLEDYSIGTNLCDYRVAYTETVDMSNKLHDVYKDQGEFDRTFDGVLEMRNRVDDAIKSSPKEKVILFVPE